MEGLSRVDLLQEVNKIDAYTQTKLDPQFLLEQTKKRLGVKSFLNFSFFHFQIILHLHTSISRSSEAVTKDEQEMKFQSLRNVLACRMLNME
jgi:hypothetical protein